MTRIYVDADACPVKDEVYRVAKRYGLRVSVVSNGRMRVPDDPLVEMVVVSGRFDAADDWIAERVTESDVAVTSDIPLASLCLAKGARVLGTGEPRIGAHGKPVLFLHPKDFNGTLVELEQA